MHDIKLQTWTVYHTAVRTSRGHRWFLTKSMIVTNANANDSVHKHALYSCVSHLTIVLEDSVKKEVGGQAKIPLGIRWNLCWKAGEKGVGGQAKIEWEGMQKYH